MSKSIYAEELRKHFGADTRRINHALKVLHYAELIMDGEKVPEAMRKIITITALLHDVGIKAAEAKYRSAAGNYQELEGPPIARTMMHPYGEPHAVMDRVAYIIGGHHTAAKNDGLDFQIVWEADLLVNIEEEGWGKEKDKLPGIIEKNFRTVTGKNIARRQFL